MIIKHTPDAKTPETDTDKLPDVEAMIMEKSEELRDLCFKSCRQMLLVVDAKGTGEGGGCQFWNMKMATPEMKDIPDGTKMVNDTEEKNRAYTNILSMADQFVGSLTQGKVRVLSMENYNNMGATIAAYHAEVERLKEKLGSHGLGDEG
jgi:hypothetical protein